MFVIITSNYVKLNYQFCRNYPTGTFKRLQNRVTEQKLVLAKKNLIGKLGQIKNIRQVKKKNKWLPY